MRIVVCMKPAAEGEWNPFDACAYETALRIAQETGGEVLLLSMAPKKTEKMLSDLTRLGAAKGYLLCDGAFAGADTLATAYTLSLAVRKLRPDLVVCGRQTIDGDTAQTGPSLSVMAGLSLITNVMEVRKTKGRLQCLTREGETETAAYPALITVERICRLRLPSIRSKRGEVIVWDAGELGADRARCGMAGSPTRVLSSARNEEGKRRCHFVEGSRLEELVEEGLRRERQRRSHASRLAPGQDVRRLPEVWTVGDGPAEMARAVGERIRRAEGTCAAEITEWAIRARPEVILWGSDPWSKRTAPQVAALLGTGLCADCTALETDGENLYMYRPTFSGNVIAKIVCRTRPQMATVRTAEREAADVVCALGKGAGGMQAAIEAYVRERNSAARGKPDGGRWEIGASRGAVDAEMLSYEKQIGLTGKTVTPAVYLAVGISGAVHHIVGMRQAGLVIAVNPDRQAPIFEYADFGILGRAEEIFGKYVSQNCNFDFAGGAV